MPSYPLVDEAELARFLQDTIEPGKADIAIQVAQGWLIDATGLSEWPDPLPRVLWSWAVELAAIAYDNPRNYASRDVGAESYGYSAAARRSAILEEAKKRFWTGNAPRGRFPPAEPWPAAG